MKFSYPLPETTMLSVTQGICDKIMFKSKLKCPETHHIRTNRRRTSTSLTFDFNSSNFSTLGKFYLAANKDADYNLFFDASEAL